MLMRLKDLNLHFVFTQHLRDFKRMPWIKLGKGEARKGEGTKSNKPDLKG